MEGGNILYFFLYPLLGKASSHGTSLVAQMVKRLSTMQETWVRSLGQEDSLEKEVATHSSTLAWKIPWTEKPGVHGVAKSQTGLSDFGFTFLLTERDFLVIIPLGYL